MFVFMAAAVLLGRYLSTAGVCVAQLTAMHLSGFYMTDVVQAGTCR